MTDPYWHFVRVDSNGTPRLGYGDNREVKVGETLRVEGRPILCEHGLHASPRIWDALGYTQGNKLSLCRVTLGGDIVTGDDKATANERTVVAMLSPEDTEKLLRDYARWCALQVIHLWDAPDVVRQYLETGDESLRDAAWDAAWATAKDAAWATAKDAAMHAAWDAAKDAARAAAWDAARAAAWDAAWAAAWDAEIEKYIAELEQRGLKAIDKAMAEAATPHAETGNETGGNDE